MQNMVEYGILSIAVFCDDHSCIQIDFLYIYEIMRSDSGKDGSMPMQNGVPESFQECLGQLMEERALSAGLLADMLQYKSKTTLLRVLQGKAGVRCVSNVYADLCRCEVLHLTEEEIDRLQVAYDVELWGLENYRARSEMRRFMRKSGTKQNPMWIQCMDGSTVLLEELFARFVPNDTKVSLEADEVAVQDNNAIPVEHLEMFVLSSGYPYVMHVLAGLLRRLGNRVHVRQLLQLNGDTARTVRLIRCLLPVLPYHNHEVFTIRQEDFSHDPIYSYGIGRALILRATLPDGQTREFQILIRDEHSGAILESPKLWDYWMRYLDIYMQRGSPMKSQVPDLRDYLQMLEYYGEIEKGREMLVFKGDVCFDYVPVDILVNSIEAQSFTEEGLSQLVKVLPKLRIVQEKRFQNVVSKREPTHWIASSHKLREMAETGKMQSHFFGMRPFTLEERIRIFQLLLRMVEENPYFHMYMLLPEEADLLDMDIAYMVGRGIQIIASDTDYSMENGWSETMLTECSFCDLYQEFFMEELIPNHTYAPEKSAEILREILQEMEEKRDA